MRRALRLTKQPFSTRSGHFAFSIFHLALLASALFAAMYLFTALPRVFYPYDLDFIEDSMLMQSLRFAQGRPVYIAPTADFVPHVYMPLYSWLGGLALRLAAPGFAPLRLLSLAATLGTAALLYYIAHRESGQHWLAFACAALYLGGYRISGFWYELARVDSLAVFLSLCGLALAIYHNGSTTRLLLAAATLALAFFAKQTALAYGFGLMPYLWLSHGKRAVLFAVVWVALIIAPLAWLNANTGGWFIYHTFRTAGGDEVQFSRAVHFATVELFGWMIPLSLIIAGTAAQAVRRNGWRGVAQDHPWLAGAATAALISGVGRASVGGNVNNLMPVFAVLCLAPALLWREANAARFTLPPWLIPLAIVGQLALGVYNPVRYIPTAQMRASGQQLIQRLAATDGNVLVMMHPYYAWLAGKTPSAQISNVWYIAHWQRQPLPADLVARIQTHYYSAIISDETLFETDPLIHDLIAANYPRAESLPASESPPTLTGVVVRPMLVYTSP